MHHNLFSGGMLRAPLATRRWTPHYCVRERAMYLLCAVLAAALLTVHVRAGSITNCVVSANKLSANCAGVTYSITELRPNQNP